MKYSIEQLAAFGGEPAFAKKLHVGCPNIGNQEKLLERLKDILDRRCSATTARTFRNWKHILPN